MTIYFVLKKKTVVVWLFKFFQYCIWNS